jgi:hypothetical protein
VKDGRVVLRVFCGQCAADPNVKTPSRLGTVVDQGRSGRLWIASDPQARRLRGRRHVGPDADGYLVVTGEPPPPQQTGVSLDHPYSSQSWVPETLPAVCKRHGRGGVALSDVLNRTGSIVLNLTAKA